MPDLPIVSGFQRVVQRKPVQAGKFIGILLALTFGIAGFLRFINFTAVVGDPRLGDGQLLALLVLPLLSFGLVFVVFLETLVAVYHFIREDTPMTDRVTGRWGYFVLRGAESLIALIGVGIMVAVVPILFAASTPAPIGVGAMLLLGLVAVFILLASFARSAAELFVYT